VITAAMIVVAMIANMMDHEHSTLRWTSEHCGVDNADRVVITRSSLPNAKKHAFDHGWRAFHRVPAGRCWQANGGAPASRFFDDPGSPATPCTVCQGTHHSISQRRD